MRARRRMRRDRIAAAVVARVSERSADETLSDEQMTGWVKTNDDSKVFFSRTFVASRVSRLDSLNRASEGLLSVFRAVPVAGACSVFPSKN